MRAPRPALIALTALSAVALSGCVSTPSAAPSSAPTVTVTEQAPAASAQDTAASQAPSNTAAAPTQASASDVDQAFKNSARGQAERIDGWLKGWDNAGCTNADLNSNGQGRGCLNKAKGGINIVDSLPKALLGNAPAGSALEGALSQGAMLVSQWESNNCMQDARDISCVDTAKQLIPAMESLASELKAV